MPGAPFFRFPGRYRLQRRPELRGTGNPGGLPVVRPRLHARGDHAGLHRYRRRDRRYPQSPSPGEPGRLGPDHHRERRVADPRYRDGRPGNPKRSDPRRRRFGRNRIYRRSERNLLLHDSRPSRGRHGRPVRGRGTPDRRRARTGSRASCPKKTAGRSIWTSRPAPCRTGRPAANFRKNSRYRTNPRRCTGRT